MQRLPLRKAADRSGGSKHGLLPGRCCRHLTDELWALTDSAGALLSGSAPCAAFASAMESLPFRFLKVPSSNSRFRCSTKYRSTATDMSRLTTCTHARLDAGQDHCTVACGSLACRCSAATRAVTRRCSTSQQSQ